MKLMASERTPLCRHSYANPSINNDLTSKEQQSSFFTTSGTTTEANLTDCSATSAAPVQVVELEELLQTLEKASGIIKAHLQGSSNVVIAPPRRRRPLVPHWVTNYLFIITLIWQGLNIGLLEGLHSLRKEGHSMKAIDSASTAVMTTFQALNLLLMLYVTFKLVRQFIGRKATGYQIAQSYLSTVLLFAGLYTLEFNINHKAWQLDAHGRKFRPVVLFLHMLYFSVSTATLCGTSQVQPTYYYAESTVAFQMLTSFVYFASILSVAIVPTKRSHSAPTGRGLSGRLLQIIRWCICRGND